VSARLARAAEVVDLLAELVAERVIGQVLARLDGAGAAPIYSTARGCGPPGTASRRAARDRIRAVPGHRREGRGRATTWTVTRTAYIAHHARAAAVAPPTMAAARTDDELASRALAAAGLRSTKRSA
jgi:hypothetical protein